MPKGPKKIKKKQRNDKRLAQRNHARKRLMTRYGIILTKKLRYEMINEILSGKSEFVKKQSNRLSVHIVSASEDLRIPAVYDSQRKEIVTFLLREWIKEKEGELNGKTFD